eukprot:1300516-Lingulodinium_polyedra.AAC.1
MPRGSRSPEPCRHRATRLEAGRRQSQANPHRLCGGTAGGFLHLGRPVFRVPCGSFQGHLPKATLA